MEERENPLVPLMGNESDDDSGHSVEHEENEQDQQVTSTENPKKRLSKKEKKLLQREKHREMLHEVKKRKREMKKELQREKRLKLDEERVVRLPRTENDSIAIDRKLRKQQEQQEFLKACESNFEVILDCAWESDHNESSLKSLIQQIMFCYGANRKSKTPCTIRLFGMGPQTKERLQKVSYGNWLSFHCYEDDFTDHIDWFSRDLVESSSQSANCSGAITANAPAVAEEKEDSAAESANSILSTSIPMRKRQLVYLTSDADETLETLDPNCTYIIGGIVDRNRLKGITHQKAIANNIRAAKLPIKDLFALSTTHVLTVNHVFDIMLQFQQTHSWYDAMNYVLPKRKDAKPISSTENTAFQHSSEVEDIANCDDYDGKDNEKCS
jgi:tRNA (guanine9-N1)-methyltransferase